MQRRMLYMRKTPLSSAAILYLLVAGLVLFPTQWLGDLFFENEQLAAFFGLGVLRLVMAAIMLALAFHMGIRGAFLPQKGEWRALLFALPALVVAINNLPVVGLCRGTVEITGSAGAVALFALQWRLLATVVGGNSQIRLLILLILLLSPLVMLPLRTHLSS